MHNCVCVKNEYAEMLKKISVSEDAAIGFGENIIYLMHLKPLYWHFLRQNIQDNGGRGKTLKCKVR